ncbi:unnamed protein product, partial [Dibothriocephalus latus]
CVTSRDDLWWWIWRTGHPLISSYEYRESKDQFPVVEDCIKRGFGLTASSLLGEIQRHGTHGPDDSKLGQTIWVDFPLMIWETTAMLAQRESAGAIRTRFESVEA